MAKQAKTPTTTDIATLKADYSAAQAEVARRTDELRLLRHRQRPGAEVPLSVDVAELRLDEAKHAAAVARWRVEHEAYHALPAHQDTVAFLEDARAEVLAIGKLRASDKYEEAAARTRRLRRRINERQAEHNAAIAAPALYGRWWAFPSLNGQQPIGEMVDKLVARFEAIDTPPPEPARLAHMRRDLEARKADAQRVWQEQETQRQAMAEQERREAEAEKRRQVEAAAAKKKRREQNPIPDLGAERRQLAAAWDARHGVGA